jgi:hypothetical protein
MGHFVDISMRKAKNIANLIVAICVLFGLLSKCVFEIENRYKLTKAFTQA